MGRTRKGKEDEEWEELLLVLFVDIVIIPLATVPLIQMGL